MVGTLSPDLERFETMRLELFASHGFEATSKRTATSVGNETYMIDGGAGPPTQILIHGGLSESAHWAMLAGRLKGRVLIPDRPGYGLSYPIDYRQVDDFADAAAEWVLSVVDASAEETVDLIGTSMGGFFAICFAARHPERVRRLVLVGAPAGVDRHIPLFLRMWANPFVGRLFMKATMDDPEQLRERVYPGLVAHPERVPAEQLEVEFLAGQLPDFALTAHSMLRASIGPLGFRRRYRVRDQLTALEMPTLIVWGNQDTGFYPPSLGREIASGMAKSEFTIVPNAGHMPWIDQPYIVAAAVNEFLNKTSVDDEQQTTAYQGD